MNVRLFDSFDHTVEDEKITSSMSGSFHRPGPACMPRPITLSRLVMIESQVAVMSGDVRHELPTLPAAHSRREHYTEMVYCYL